MELRGLVNELDERLPTSRTRDPDPVIIHDPRFTTRTWFGLASLGFAAGLALLLTAAFVAASPWQSDCGYADHICEIAELDIDALRVAIPNSELIASLPDIDALDPHDELTAGDVFGMDEFSHLDFEQLLTDDDVDLLLGDSR